MKMYEESLSLIPSIGVGYDEFFSITCMRRHDKEINSKKVVSLQTINYKWKAKKLQMIDK